MTTVSDNQPNGYAAVAEQLRHIADQIDGLPGGPAYVSVDFQPVHTDDYIVLKRQVNALGHTLLGEFGKTTQTGRGGCIHKAAAERRGVHIHVYGTVAKMPDPRDAEIEQLRRENATLRARDQS